MDIDCRFLKLRVKKLQQNIIQNLWMHFQYVQYLQWAEGYVGTAELVFSETHGATAPIVSLQVRQLQVQQQTSILLGWMELWLKSRWSLWAHQEIWSTFTSFLVSFCLMCPLTVNTVTGGSVRGFGSTALPLQPWCCWSSESTLAI